MNTADRLSAALADRYRLERELGQGGMATVYLAADLKHDRQVAIKVLKPELAAVLGAERFVQEIKTTAALSHPHILPLFDSGTAEGFLYYVMPYVQGETLRSKLDREKQLGVEEAVKIAREVADALDYAHRQGVVHRDIKPENILLHDGRPMVADFGIALAVSAAAGGRMTETGLSLGTPHYMSPEQATAEKEITARSDVYSLASVLYEMLAGQPPHLGGSAQQIIMKIIAEPVAAVTSLRKSVPANVAAALAQALEKLPADRFDSAKAFAEALANPAFTTRSTTAAGARGGAGPGAPDLLVRSWAALWRPAAGWAVAGVLAVALFGVLMVTPRRVSAPGRVTRFTIRLPSDAWFTFPSLSVARDGRTIVMPVQDSAGGSVWAYRLDRATYQKLTPSAPESGVRPAVSPDGGWIVYTADGRLWKKSVDGQGGPVALADGANWGGGAWSREGGIVYTPRYQSGLWQVSEEGGDAHEVSRPDSARGELGHWWPQFLPGGRYVLFTAYSSPMERSRIEVLDLRTGERKDLVEGAYGRFVPSGHLLFVRGNNVLAVPFDLGSRAVRGQAVPVLDDIAVASPDGVAGFDVSDDGTLVYLRASTFNAPSDLVWVDGSGREARVLDRPALYDHPALSPDGRHLAVQINEGGSDIWVYELARGVFSRLTRHAGVARNPVWTPDGRRVIYEGEVPQYDLFWRAVDGSAAAETLLTTPNDKHPYSVTPDGRYLLYNETDPRVDLWMLALDGTGERRRLTDTPFREGTPVVSPNGRWLAYRSDESGREEVYVMAFPGGGSRVQVSVDGGSSPQWTRGGRELVYRVEGRFFRVAFDPVSGRAERPVAFASGPYPTSPYVANYSVAPDGSRLLTVRVPPERQPREVEVVLNWLEELRQRVGSAP
jgi:Tol biopolymer transport system component/tRNA A-37 threonylcarbamoyl transferase component Bud32